MLIALAMLWASAGDHPLYPPDEGRYATASYWMSQSNDWLVPQFKGEPHLTKPPLVYWMQALALRVFGHEELAVRMPSLLASSVSLVLVYVAGVMWLGRRGGILATATLACMPLHTVVGRMAIIDPTLSACWLAALLSGWRAVETGRKRGAAAFWTATSLGLLAKGPLALMPLAVTAVWLALAGRFREIKRLHLMIGFPLAAAPVLAWAVLVVRAHPEAMQIWLGQTAGRLVGETGTNAHAAPPWYYVPVFVAGLFPATIMLPVPWLNTTWSSCGRRLRSGDAAAFWSISVILPLAFFTLMTGKLATYLLPLTGPMALIGAWTLERWLRDAERSNPSADRPPDFVLILMVVNFCMLTVTIFVLWRWDPALLLWAVPPLALVLISAWLWRIWKRMPHLRGRGLLGIWIAAVAAWQGVFQVEDSVRRPTNQQDLVSRIPQITGVNQPHLAIYGFRDPCIEFYAREPIPQLETAREITDLLRTDRGHMVLLVDDEDWARFAQANPECASEFVYVERSHRWFNKTMDILKPVPTVPAGDETAPSKAQ